MTSKPDYPNWYYSFRGLAMGAALGCALTTVAYESKLIVPGGAVWGYLIFPLAINLLPWVLLACFETYFAIQRYRAVRQESEPI